MTYLYLNKINSPKDLRSLPVDDLPIVCNELRQFIIDELSHNPGHLASSLGTIEITVALHYVLNTPQDKIVWDVGHQAYAHKILTGRRTTFHTNRQLNGLAPFPYPPESEYDAFIAGHASNSVSASLGLDIGNRLLTTDEAERNKVVAVIGDGAMTGGLAFEGLNNVSMFNNDVLIILNDNNMAIEHIEGGFSRYLLNITTHSWYNKLRWRIYRLALRLHLINDKKRNIVTRSFNSLKAALTQQQQNIFQGLNIRYFGPSDGHDVVQLVRILSEIKNHHGPKVLHIITKKGKGYAPAEQNPSVWHAPGEFNAKLGERVVKDKDGAMVPPLWQDVFGETLLALAREDMRVVGISPAMLSGSSMNIMQKVFPDRVFDVGIAEGHAVTFAAGLAKAGMIPFCCIYSSFLQRAFDNVIHDNAILNLPVVLCIDRAGIVGNDGITHHGLFDMAYLRLIPHITIIAPRSPDLFVSSLRWAKNQGSLVAIRYPRGRCRQLWRQNERLSIQCGKALPLRTGADMAVLSIGAIGNTVIDAIDACLAQYPQASIAHYDMMWLKPIDAATLHHIGQHFTKIVTIEEGTIRGGLFSAVAEFMTTNGYQPTIMPIGIDDHFVEHGSTQELFEKLHLDTNGICESLLQVLAK